MNRDDLSPYCDVIQETDGGGAPLASYVLGGTELLSQTRGGVTSYYLHDAQGSVRGLADPAGALTDTYSYTAFGELFAQTGSTVNSYLYTGQQFDALTGFYSLRARYYDPALGRFLSRDTVEIEPLNPRQLNRYAYVANDPTNQEDPTGLMAIEYETESQQWVEATQAFKWVVYPGWEVYRTPWYIYLLCALGITIAVGTPPLVCGWLCPGPQPLPQPMPIPTPPPAPQPETEPRPQPEETPPPPGPTETPESQRTLPVYRELSGELSADGTYYRRPRTNPAEFRLDPDGVSTFELEYLPGQRPYALGFDVMVKLPIVPGSEGQVQGLPCLATFTPEWGAGHWSLRCIPASQTPMILSAYAKDAGRTRMILNPRWAGPEDRRIP